VSGPINGGDFSLRNYAIVFRAVRYDTIRDAVGRQRAVRPAAASIPFVNARGALWRYHALMNLRRKSILYSSTVFTARHYASAEYAVVVRPSVCILLGDSSFRKALVAFNLICRVKSEGLFKVAGSCV